ncbi:MAG: FtsX-like permease family protein [Acidobacteriota bacterium]
MSPRTFWRHLLRESRGSRGRIVFFVACLAAGVASVTAVAGLSAGLEQGIRREAKTLLAADLSVRGRRPIPQEVHEAIDRIGGAERTGVREMLTLVAADAPSAGSDPPRSVLVELKSLEGLYPFYGDLELEPPGPIDGLLDATSAVVAPEILGRLQLAVGDSLKIGGASFRIAGTVLSEPDRIAGRITMGPRLFVSHAGLERAGLVRLGSRVNYKVLVRLPAERQADLEAIAEEIDAQLVADGRHRVETFTEAQPSMRRGLERTGRYLALAALLSLLIGGLGVAQTVRAWLAGRMDAIAVLKCLGYRPREVLWLYLGQTVALGLLGSLAGVALGVAVQFAATRLLADTLPVAGLELIQPWALARGLVLGIGVALLSSLPPLAAARRVPPVRVLRRDTSPLPPSRLALGGTVVTLLASCTALAAWQAGSWLRGALFTGGLLVVAVILALAAVGLTRLATRPRSHARLWLRQGLAALERPGSSTVGGIVALGVGVVALLGMFLVERALSAELAREFPRDAPTAFLIDIQPDQWPGVEALLREQQSGSIDSVPMVMARIAAVDGRRSEEIQAEIGDGPQRRGGRSGERGRAEERREAASRREGGPPGGDAREGWTLRREQRLTYLETLPADNEIIAGPAAGEASASPWSDPQAAEISVEEEFARGLGVDIGSVVTLDIQGVELDLKVTSLRRVDWGTFGINFFLVVEPGVLEAAPQSRLAAARLPRGGEQEVQDALAAAFPNVTMIRTREVLEKIATLLERLSLGVRLLGGLTVLAGLAILAGAVSAGSIRRGAEVALLKTLGMTRRQVVASFATEYALMGLVAGVIGTAGGAVLAYFVVTRGMEVTWQTEPLWLVASVGATVALAVASGLAASGGALRKRPVEVLRSVAG